MNDETVKAIEFFPHIRAKNPPALAWGVCQPVELAKMSDWILACGGLFPILS